MTNNDLEKEIINNFLSVFKTKINKYDICNIGEHTIYMTLQNPSQTEMEEHQ